MEADDEITAERVLAQIKKLNGCLVAAILGIVAGLIVKSNYTLPDNYIHVLNLPEKLASNVLRSYAFPFIVSSVVAEALKMNLNITRKIGRDAILYFLLTTFLSLTTGIVIMMVAEPLVIFSAEGSGSDDEREFFNLDILTDLILNMIPENIPHSFLERIKTQRMEMTYTTKDPTSGMMMNTTREMLDRSNMEGFNVAAVLTTSLALALILKEMGEDARIMVICLKVLNGFIKIAIQGALRMLPIVIFFMIASHVIEVEDWQTAIQLSIFLGLVLMGLLVHSAISLPTVYFLWVRCNPVPVFKASKPALVKALMSSSSAEAESFTRSCCEKDLLVDKKITSFMVHLGASLNMDGTALYSVMATLYIAQLSNIYLDLYDLFLIGLTAGIANNQAVGMGPMTSFFILSAFNFPLRDASLLILIYWLLDRCSTVVNVLGDFFGIALINEVYKSQLEQELNRPESTKSE